MEIQRTAARTEEKVDALKDSMLGEGGHVHRQEKHIRNLYTAVDSLKTTRSRLGGAWKAVAIGGGLLVGAAEVLHAVANAAALLRGQH